MFIFCSQCRDTKRSEDFASNAAKKNGKQTYCRLCTSDNKKKYRCGQTLEEKETYNAYTRNWRRKQYEQSAEYRERVLESNLLRQRSLAASPGSIDYAVILRNDPCSYCGAKAKHVDHIKPLSRGGQHVWQNLTAACERCNLTKQAKSLLEFVS